MEVQKILSRLREHSGLTVTDLQLECAAYVDIVQTCVTFHRDNGLLAATSDVVQCLQHLIEHGFFSSPGGGQHLALDVAYAVSGMIAESLKALIMLPRGDEELSLLRQALLLAVWTLSCAWDAVLAGDIEDLFQHLALERAAINDE